jgi:hypothetical protein
MSRTVFTAEEMATWPEGTKRCRDCYEIYPLGSFHKMKQCILGVSNICKECRSLQTKEHWKNKPYVRKMFDRAKTRSTALGREFTITIDDIEIQDECPVFHVPYVYDPKSPWVPSIDRIDSNKGYIPGNVMVMSWRANALKNNMTADEALALYRFMCDNENT